MTVESVHKYLQSRSIDIIDIAPITGGTSNYIWRIKHPDGRTSIFKHAEPHLSANTSFPFPLDRMNFEAQALQILPRIISYDNRVKCPEIIYHDKENHVLVLEDMGQKTLKDIYEDPGLSIKFIGERIGQWLAQIHTLTTDDDIKGNFNHTVAKQLYRWSYNSLPSTLARFGYDAALGERINSKYGSLLQTDNVCMCHTDLWPGNIVFDLNDEAWPIEPRIAIIDWEVARQGNGATDVGHFAAEAWFLDHFRGNRDLLPAFLKSYSKEKRISWDDAKRVAAQFGTHIIHWPTIYDWIDEQGTIEAIVYGHQILKQVDEGNCNWFEGGDLGFLFTPFISGSSS